MKLLSSLLLVIFTLIDSPRGYGQSTQSSSTDTNDAVARIRDEGMNHSQVMETLSMLTEVIGPRLTGSPNLKRANEWTRDQLKCFGLTNAHLEAWGPFGRSEERRVGKECRSRRGTEESKRRAEGMEGMTEGEVVRSVA